MNGPPKVLKVVPAILFGQKALVEFVSAGFVLDCEKLFPFENCSMEFIMLFGTGVLHSGCIYLSFIAMPLSCIMLCPYALCLYYFPRACYY